MLELERLEHRRLLSAVLMDGVLGVSGTNGDDEITLSVADEGQTVVVEVNGERSRFEKRRIGRVVVNAAAGNDFVRLSPDLMALPVPAPAQYGLPTLVLGGRGNDTLRGGLGNDTLDGGSGVNELDGRAGDDLLRADADTDDIRGGEGTDTVDYSDRGITVHVSLDDVANDGKPEGIAEAILVPASVDLLAGEHDNVHSDVENVFGGRGDDEIAGNKANNIFSGGGGNDLLIGGRGHDILNGNAGNDRLVGGDGADLLIGGRGNDTADYSDHLDGVIVTLDGIANDGTIQVFAVVTAVGGPTTPSTSAENDNARADIENVIGTNGNDELTGNDGSNTLVGRGGNDRLTGGEGSDYLRGGDGNDTLLGLDDSRDTLDGGNGDDLAQADLRDQVANAAATIGVRDS
jgi:Ca2+-binding RTX toxin-like protein